MSGFDAVCDGVVWVKAVRVWQRVWKARRGGRRVFVLWADKFVERRTRNGAFIVRWEFGLYVE